MDKNKINRWTVGFVVVLLMVSALGYLLAPEQMLSVVGIAGTKETNFLVRTLAAALLSLVPTGVMVMLGKEGGGLRWHVVLSLACYLVLSSAVDLYGYLSGVVNAASVPSIGFRLVIAAVLGWSNRK